MRNIGNRIKQAMMEIGLNQGEFAKKLNVTQPLISSWMTGKSKPSTTSIKKIAQFTGKPLQYFFDNDENNQVETAKNGKENSVEIELLKKEIEILKTRIDKEMQSIESLKESIKTKYDNLNLKIELLKRK
ncbi:MAG: helix-turn-helix domain-containing protein [Elusimicrobiota bacterium]|nr:helix-turn-helix domain-containing protein [Elusimicrobiota bacterium]